MSKYTALNVNCWEIQTRYERHIHILCGRLILLAVQLGVLIDDAKTGCNLFWVSHLAFKATRTTWWARTVGCWTESQYVATGDVAETSGSTRENWQPKAALAPVFWGNCRRARAQPHNWNWTPDKDAVRAQRDCFLRMQKPSSGLHKRLQSPRMKPLDSGLRLICGRDSGRSS